MKFKSIIIFASLVLVFLVSTKPSFAATLYLSPSTGNVGVGQTTAVQVRLNTSGEAVNAVSAYLSYPTDKLDVTYVSGAATFGIDAEKSFGGGVIKISRGNINPVSGNLSVATIGFKGKVPGSARVSFIGGSAVPRANDSSDSLNLGASVGGTYNVVGQTAVSQPTVNSVDSSQLTAKDTLGPKISDLKVSKVASNSATISWKTDELADSSVEYGLDKGYYFLSTIRSNLVNDHSISLESPFLQPGTKLHLRVLSKDASNNISSSEDIEVQLVGYRVKIKVIDEKSNPLANTEVILYSTTQKAKTDLSGEVVFDNVSLGKHLVVVKLGNIDKTEEIEVKELNQPQQLTIKVTNPSLVQSILPSPTYALGGLVAIFCVFLLIIVLKILVPKIISKGKSSDTL